MGGEGLITFLGIDLGASKKALLVSNFQFLCVE